MGTLESDSGGELQTGSAAAMASIKESCRQDQEGERLLRVLTMFSTLGRGSSQAPIHLFEVERESFL